MTEIKTSKGGIDYLASILVDKPLTITRATFWKILHNSGVEEVCLKLGRYHKVQGPYDWTFEQLESLEPKSELTLKGNEFEGLIDFIQTNYEPFKKGVKEYIPIDENFDPSNIEHIKAIFANPKKQEILEFIISKDIIPQDLFIGLQQLSKVKAVQQFEEMLDNDLDEHHWQKWFKENSWVLGTEFVKILDDRDIDTENISDFLMQAYDGFLDIVEIKRPEGNLKFWFDQKDHENYVPHSDLIKAITQASKYIYEVEREANSVKFLERVEHIKTIKPRCILIYGRSCNWDDEQNESYRLLNSNYHNLTILTYDHILERAKRMLN